MNFKSLIQTKVIRATLGTAILLGVAGPLASPAAAQNHNRRDYYRDSNGNWHKRHSGIGAGKGALIGGGAGAGIGALVGGGKGALIGGALGAGGGALAGNANANRRHNDQRRYDERGNRY